MATLVREWVTPGRCVAIAALVILVGTARAFLRFSVNLPVQDEWDLVSEFLTVGNLWEWIPLRHNEHRFWLGRSVWGSAFVLSGYNFRAGGVITIALLALSCLGLLRTVVKVRGQSSLADLLVPALLLNAGHAFNFVMGYQVVFAMVAVCGCGLIATAMRAGRVSTFRTGVEATLWLVLMSGNGGFGIAFAPPVAAWIAYIAWRQGCESGRWRSATLLLLGAGVVLAYCAWTHLTQPPSSSPERPFVTRIMLSVAAGYLAMGLGSILTDPIFVASGWVPGIVSGVVVLYLATSTRLTVVFVKEPKERIRTMGLLAILTAQVAVALGIGLSRDAGLADRYATPAAVGLLTCWAAWVCYPPRALHGRVPGLALCVLAAVGVAAANARPHPECSIAALMRSPLKQMQNDMKDGMPASFLAGKYGNSFGVMIGDRIQVYLPQFQAAGLSQFQAMTLDPPMTVVRLTVPGDSFHVPTTPRCVEILGEEAWQLHAPAGYVHGLKLDIDQSVIDGLQLYVLEWTGAEGRRKRAVAYAPFFVNHGSVAFWIHGPATDVRLARWGSGMGPLVREAAWLVPGLPPHFPCMGGPIKS